MAPKCDAFQQDTRGNPELLRNALPITYCFTNASKLVRGVSMKRDTAANVNWCAPSMSTRLAKITGANFCGWQS